MKTRDFIQGTPEWLADRAQGFNGLPFFNASDAPAMMGCSTYTTRAQLLRDLHTGMTGQVDAATQRRFDDGHRFEALARPLAEAIIGDDLYPVVGSEGRLSASFDGLTLDEGTPWEHKTLNDALRAILPAEGVGGPEVGAALPLQNRVQMEQQCMVSGAGRELFTASRWSGDDELIEARHCWYTPDAELRAAIASGWEQFEADLAAYTLPPAAEPAPIGRAPDALPALRIEVTGAVTASNLAEFKHTALTAIRSVNRDLKTDADFADADKAAKWCADVEARLKAAKDHALSQTADIDALFRTLDEISAEARATRLDLEKTTKRRKDELREQAVAAARRALEQHVATLQAELAPLRLLPVAVDFAGAIKGLRSIASMQDALDGALATAKIAADSQARTIRGNVAAFKTAAAGLEALFADLHNIVHKAPDDFAAIVDQRITKHRAMQAEVDAARQAAEAQRIAEAEQRAREQAEREATERQRQADEKAARDAQASADVVLQKLPEAVRAGVIEPDRAERIGGLVASLQADAVIQGARVAANEPASVKLGDLADRLGFTLRADFIETTLGIKAAGRAGTSVLFQPRQVPAIITALQQHLARVAAGISRAA